MSDQTAVKVVSKMSIKALGCNPKKANALPDDDTAGVRLATIYGRADGTKSDEDKRTSQIWTALVGNFEGINLETGEKYQSGKLFLPGGIQETIEAPLQAMKSRDENGSIEFAFEIRAVKASNPIGYAYQALPMLKPVETDLFSQLRAQVLSRSQELGLEMPAGLAAPEQKQIAAAPAAAPAPAAAKTAHAGGKKK